MNNFFVVKENITLSMLNVYYDATVVNLTLNYAFYFIYSIPLCFNYTMCLLKKFRQRVIFL